ncbi:MAG: hypothetical protein JNM57_16790 [Cyclobacteriaceae bacterium]|nr:hypothetical protein [Cyclobacteriaceae bacterium]
MKTILLSSLFIILSTSIYGQKKEYDINALLQKQKLTSINRNTSPVTDGKIKGVKLDENAEEGIVWLNDVIFSNGTLEIDLRGQDVFQRSFLGLAFHGVNDSTYDAVYFRPFNFHAEDPIRKIHAVQYISHPVHTWKKLRDEQNGIFEKALVNPPDANGWFHARIEVSDKTISVYVNKDTTPSLTVTKISNQKTGKVGLWVGDGSGGEFANLRITKSK